MGEMLASFEARLAHGRRLFFDKGKPRRTGEPPSSARGSDPGPRPAHHDERVLTPSRQTTQTVTERNRRLRRLRPARDGERAPP
jgi:hypothetical protein